MKNDYIIEYRIYPKVYEEMTFRNKNMEIRLLNEKSEKIKIGDKIKFEIEDI